MDRPDANQQEIVDAYRAAGATCEWIRGVTRRGILDLLVGFRGQTYLVEVKRLKYGRLSPEQEKFIEGWRGGPLAVVRTVPEALAVIGLTAP